MTRQHSTEENDHAVVFDPMLTDDPLATETPGGIFAGKGKFIVAATVLLGALVYLAVIAFQSATVYSYTVTELSALGPTPEGKLVRVNGSLVENSFARPDGSTKAHFTLTDKDGGTQAIAANYDGVLPDLFFNPHSEIILEGTYGADGVFNSQNVLVKCPSKYIEATDDGSYDQSAYSEGKDG